ncbi:MAG: ribonuclease VapC [Candidatus Aenigmarchaeota archaeon]|nr:ribonuclease VapC [Candidatus Aenigmarchaeota archaeon]
MRVVLDTSAFIYLNDFRMFEEIFTVSEVIEEVKDKITSLKLQGITMEIMEPSGNFVKKVISAAKETGDYEKLSKTDIKVLALANEFNLTIISDDYNVQNVAEKLGIDYMSVFNKRITRLIKWGNYCKTCKNFFENESTCPKCGSKLTRIARQIGNLSQKAKV